MFPSRGDPDEDRQFRHPRQRVDRKPKIEGARVKLETVSSPGGLPDAFMRPLKVEDDMPQLPELDIVKEGVVAFTNHYFQLGFIPKERFLLQLEQDLESVSRFLLFSILSISARFNKKIRLRFGATRSAVDWFLEHAEKFAIVELYQSPTLERCQAFLLLSIAQQGNGMSNSSYVRAPNNRPSVMDCADEFRSTWALRPGWPHSCGFIARRRTSG